MRGTHKIAGLMAIAGGVLLPWLARLAVEQTWPLPHCWFHELTGFDCPFCGGTRCLAALSHGDLLTAFGQNPAVCLACFTGMAWLVLSQCLPCRIWSRVNQHLFERRDRVAGMLMVLLALNWGFLLWRMR